MYQAQTGAIRAYHAQLDETAAVAQLQHGGGFLLRWRWQTAMAMVLLLAAVFAWSARPLSTEIEALAGDVGSVSTTDNSVLRWEQEVRGRDVDRDQR